MPILSRICGQRPDIDTRTFRIANVGESIVEQRVGAALLGTGIELGYCARPGEVDVRVIGPKSSVAAAERIMRDNFADAIFTAADESLAAVIVRTLIEQGETLAVAESCTGGFLANQITNVPGASSVFVAGAVTYSNEEKIRALGVSRDSLSQFGAVSENVAREMAEGMRRVAAATHAIATTGIAGPSGATEGKPVGTVYVAIASENAPTICHKHLFVTDRETFKQMVSQAAFDRLRRRLLR